MSQSLDQIVKFQNHSEQTIQGLQNSLIVEIVTEEANQTIVIVTTTEMISEKINITVKEDQVMIKKDLKESITIIISKHVTRESQVKLKQLRLKHLITIC